MDTTMIVMIILAILLGVVGLRWHKRRGVRRPRLY